MGQKVKNVLKGVLVGGDYIGGDSTINNYYGCQEEAGEKENSNDKTIFLSYNWHDGETADRIFPAVVETSIYEPLVRAEYINYWKQECDKLEAAVRGLDPTNAVELIADLKRYKNIASSIGEFLSMVSDRNNPDIRDVEKQIEKAVLKN